MSLTATVLRELIALGVTGDALVAAVERIESAHAASVEEAVAKATAKADAELAARKAKAQENTRRWREAKAAKAAPVISPCITETHGDDGDILCADAPAQVVISNSSLRSELLDTPKKPSVSIPKGTDEKRGSRLPDDWNPVPDYDPHSFGLSVEQHDAELAKFRDYWRSVPGAKGRRLDWPATWRNWMRRAAENQPRKPYAQHHPDQRQAARDANLERAFAGSEQAMRQRAYSG